MSNPAESSYLTVVDGDGGVANPAAPVLEAVLGIVPGFLWVCDVDGNCVYANPLLCEALGLEPHAIHLESVAQKVDRFAEGEELVFHEQIRCRDGASIAVRVHARAVSVAGRELRLFHMLQTTEAARTSEHVTQAQKLEAIGQLAAGIAHEINTPTQYVGDNTRFLKDAFDSLTKCRTAYRALLEAAKEGPVPTEVVEAVERSIVSHDIDFLMAEIPPAIEQSLEGLEQIARIVRAMKEFSHPGMGEKAFIDVNSAIENTITVARNEWKYVADMVTDLDPDLPLAPCLPGAFNQVLLNLIVNAAHAIEDAIEPGGKGTITVTTRADGDFVEVRIGDTGVGIPEHIRTRVYDPFFTTKEVGRGTGQGLALTYSIIVEKHGGTITFDSEPGKGTTFVLRLPVNASLQEACA